MVASFSNSDSGHPEEEGYLLKSKSQIKRDMQALRDLGEKLTALSDSELVKLPISERLLEAVQQAKSFKRQALRRQIGRIGALMREEDDSAILDALEALNRAHQEDIQTFHRLEQWRDGLMDGDQSILTMLVENYAAERQHLRQLVRNASKEKSLEKSPKAYRLLFQYLRELMKEVESS